MSRDPQTPPGGSRQSEPLRNLGEALDALQAEREKRERMERERDDLRRLAVKAERALREVIDDRDSAERRLDEAVKALREWKLWSVEHAARAHGLAEALANYPRTAAPDGVSAIAADIVEELKTREACRPRSACLPARA